MSHSLTYLLSDSLKARDASASKKHLHVGRPGAEWDEGRGGEVSISINDVDWMVCLIITIIACVTARLIVGLT